MSYCICVYNTQRVCMAHSERVFKCKCMYVHEHTYKEHTTCTCILSVENAKIQLFEKYSQIRDSVLIQIHKMIWNHFKSENVSVRMFSTMKILLPEILHLLPISSVSIMSVDFTTVQHSFQISKDWKY